MNGGNGLRVLGVGALLLLFTFISAANFIPKADRLESFFLAR